MKKDGDNPGGSGKTVFDVENSLIGLFAIVYSGSVEEVEKKYGKEGFEAARKGFNDSMVQADIEVFETMKDRSLKAYIDWLLSAITEGHEYEILENRDDSVKFKFTSCPWADHFRAIGKQHIGKFFCDADGPLATAFNKNIKFEITKTLMNGDAYCNHHYYVEKAD